MVLNLLKRKLFKTSYKLSLFLTIQKSLEIEVESIVGNQHMTLFFFSFQALKQKFKIISWRELRIFS